MTGLRRVRVRDFRRYVDQTFVFGDGTAFVEGPNNAGKTTLFLAVEYAIFGRVGGAGPAPLLRAGAKAMGVELEFEGRDGRTYRLQRMHTKGTRGKAVLGHFTLKVRAGDDAPEQYLCASDFQDTEDVLAERLAAALGVGRRTFDLAVHLRQGTVADLLDGSSQLDIVLGVTGAVAVEEELRALALAATKAADELPAVEATLTRLGTERAERAARVEALAQERAGIAGREVALREARASLTAEAEALRPLERRLQEIERARVAARDAARDLERLQAEGAAAGEEAVLAAAELTAREALAAAQRALDELRGEGEDPSDGLQARKGDLEGRLRRRRAVVEGGRAECEACGQVVDAEHLRRELPALEEELRGVVDALAAATAARKARRAEVEARTEAVADARSGAKEAKRSLDARRSLSERLAAAAAAHGEAERALAGLDPAEGLADEVAAKKADLQGRRSALAVEEKHHAAALARLDADALDAAEGLRRSERDHAATQARRDQLAARLAEGRRLRVLAKAFKAVQETLREGATRKLAARTLELHRHLSGDAGDVLAVEVDPARYAVHVTPADVGESVPATVHLGGGHRLLLGLAERLALAEQLGPVPFVLLDEPTYGLDRERRAALLDRVRSLGVTSQLLVVTHHDVDAPGARRIRVVRDGTQSRVEGP